MRLALCLLLAGCAATTPPPNALNGGPISTCIMICLVTVQLLDSDGGDQAATPVEQPEAPQ